MCYTPESKLILKGNYFNEKGKKKKSLLQDTEEKAKAKVLEGIDPLQEKSH